MIVCKHCNKEIRNKNKVCCSIACVKAMSIEYQKRFIRTCEQCGKRWFRYRRPKGEIICGNCITAIGKIREEEKMKIKDSIKKRLEEIKNRQCYICGSPGTVQYIHPNALCNKHWVRWYYWLKNDEIFFLSNIKYRLQKLIMEAKNAS